jgi:hypothetical protein
LKGRSEDLIVSDPKNTLTSSHSANGGNITITSTGSILFLDGSQITTSVLTALGNGGRITLGSANHSLGALVLANSFVQANASGGAGGDIGLFADIYLKDGGAVSALSEFSTPGTIEIEARVTDLGNALAALPGDLLQAVNLLRSTCASRTAEGRMSSLVVAQREGLPPEPDGLLSSPLSLAPVDDSAFFDWTLNSALVTPSRDGWASSNCTN